MAKSWDVEFRWVNHEHEPTYIVFMDEVVLFLEIEWTDYDTLPFWKGSMPLGVIVILSSKSLRYTD